MVEIATLRKRLWRNTYIKVHNFLMENMFNNAYWKQNAIQTKDTVTH